MDIQHRRTQKFLGGGTIPEVIFNSCFILKTSLDGLGIESRWGRDFPHASGPALGHTQPPIQWVPGLSQG